MSVIDRVESAKHTLTGSSIGKAAAKASSREIIGPKKKHVDYLLQALGSDNVSIPNLADMLFERCTHSSWVVTFKALITCHYLMSGESERFIQYVASRATTWTLHNFIDKNGVQAYDMSHAIRRYSSYLSEKAFSYRQMGYDFCRLERGKSNGVLRNMDTAKLLKAMPILQRQIDQLLSTEVKSNELTNGVITAAFMLLFKDLIRLFASYNDGVINLLEKYFEMKKTDCRSALDIYKKFVNRMESVSAFLKIAEDVGIDKGDIPDLTKAPSSLLEALEDHLQSLEKGKGALPPATPISLPAFVADTGLSKVDGFLSMVDEENVKADDYLEQERKALAEFEKRKQAKQQASSPRLSTQQLPTAAPLSPPNQVHRHAVAHTSSPMAPVTAFPTATPSTNSAADDLLQLNPSAGLNSQLTQSSRTMSYPGQAGDPFLGTQGGMHAFGVQQPAGFSANNPFASTGNMAAPSADFNGAFSHQRVDTTPALGDLLAPTVFGDQHPAGSKTQNSQDPKDLNSSLQKMAQSLDELALNSITQRAATQKGQHQWKPKPEYVRTGGANFQGPGLAKSSLPAVQPGWNSPPQQMGYVAAGGNPYAMQQQPMMMSGGARFQVAGPGMQAQQPMAGFGGLQQPALQVQQDPFGPIPGSQARF